LQNRDHVACQYVHIVLYWSLAHNCHENQKDYVILLAAQVQCTEILKWPTYDSFDYAFGIVFPRALLILLFYFCMNFSLSCVLHTLPILTFIWSLKFYCV
jgi:hypothetical protein